MYKILVTNDDGVDSEGIIVLAEALAELGEVTVVAPLNNMTAVSHSITLNRPLRIEKRAERCYAVDGTPTDCVALAVNLVMKDDPPALVVSGINKGANLGDDVHYSGTVAGAREATMYRIPAIAVSLAGRSNYKFAPAAEIAVKVAAKVLANGLPHGTLLNVNVPRTAIKGVVITRQGTKLARTKIIETLDPRQRSFYWIGEEFVSWDNELGTDYAAVNSGFVSITPLKNDATDYSRIEMLQTWDETWLRADSKQFEELLGKDKQ
ncbi:MAG: 5'/3'-nucleotidase SurE [Acidobacteriota bacterium]|nr:5'/3'-nucleotidase SurE [Blastocatellia bacterium]MDW8412346.1 5'/3'-nucleotidase SurE [Acidobacteriota bacterium]